MRLLWRLLLVMAISPSVLTAQFSGILLMNPSHLAVKEITSTSEQIISSLDPPKQPEEPSLVAAMTEKTKVLARVSISLAKRCIHRLTPSTNTIINFLYILAILLSIISSYQLDKIFLSGSIKNFFADLVSSTLGNIKVFGQSQFSAKFMNSPEMYTFITDTQLKIESRALFINPNSINLEQLQRLEHLAAQALKSLATRGENLPHIIQAAAAHCTAQTGLPALLSQTSATATATATTANHLIQRVLNLQFLVYSHEAMITLLKQSYIENLIKEHNTLLFQLFHKEITNAILAVRSFYIQSRLLDIPIVIY
ncbi:hypothetical protein NEHOM01_0054 [Nematocida homosporus]|uniref:uncharacterized protein n=1 Tax=Nematocida homosporus TaxID=1912981 RepID=UPI0022205570|nr:uncharacterized protein NEHOM01_0054 [Nematocida homosporus]KAI5184309.1 hypothetical protein NEHOM01_0054 [Nematocida homosporus]